jgi:DNA-binding MarR family transcriptional regulator
MRCSIEQSVVQRMLTTYVSMGGAPSVRTSPGKVLKLRPGREDAALDVTRLTKSIGFLTRVVHLQMREFMRARGQLEISPAIYSLLVLLGANPGIQQVRAAVLMAVQESNMATLIKELLSARLIKRGARRAAGNGGGLHLTERGHVLLRRVEDSFIAIDREYASVLSDQEYEVLTSLLRKLFQGTLQATPPQPAPVATATARIGRQKRFLG